MNSGTDLVPILAGAVSSMTPLLLAALGGLFTELTGMLNIALEGLITIGAFAGVMGAQAGGSVFAGLVAGVAASMLVALVYGLVTLKLHANEFITGLAANLFAAGITVVLSQELFGTKAVVPFVVPPLWEPFRGLALIPVLGPVLFAGNFFAPLSWVAVLVSWVVIRRTVFGMRLRATGSSERSVVALGLDPGRSRLAAILISGAACGLAGCALSLPLSAYVPNISSGRGWIALVAIYLGGRKPSGILVACFVFAAAESFSNFAQGFLQVPSDFILAIPYVFTLVALILGSVAKKIGGGR